MEATRESKEGVDESVEKLIVPGVKACTNGVGEISTILSAKSCLPSRKFSQARAQGELREQFAPAPVVVEAKVVGEGWALLPLGRQVIANVVEIRKVYGRQVPRRVKVVERGVLLMMIIIRSSCFQGWCKARQLEER